MKTLIIGKNCIEVEKTDSTNSYLLRMTTTISPVGDQPKGVFEGTVVVARIQEQGRGQRGAGWESEPGKNLTMSILLNPTFLRPDEQFQLNKAVSLGVAEFVHPLLHLPQRGRETAPRPGSLPFGESGERGMVSIKWPNDIYIGNKKIAGILIENTVSGNKLQQSVVGIGINVNQEKLYADLPNPTSLKRIIGKEFDQKQCLEELCSCIEARYLQLRAGQTESLDADYLKHLYRYGEPAHYKYKGETLKAKITGVSKTGKLLLEKENGERLECDFKEVRFC